MNNIRAFTKRFSSTETAQNFANNTAGKLDDNMVTFQGSYTISKALYSVGHNAYKVYIKIHPTCPDGHVVTFCVYSNTSQDAYAQAREKIKSGVL